MSSCIYEQGSFSEKETTVSLTNSITLYAAWQAISLDLMKSLDWTLYVDDTNWEFHTEIINSSELKQFKWKEEGSIGDVSGYGGILSPVFDATQYKYLHISGYAYQSDHPYTQIMIYNSNLGIWETLLASDILETVSPYDITIDISGYGNFSRLKLQVLTYGNFNNGYWTNCSTCLLYN